ncbi:MAG: 6-phosphogluconolactonase, partial [Myxococcales bacterium]|nr:6-phosphogluconolactonase [Myxococcales bacterium]
LHVSALPAMACADWLIDRVETVIAEQGRCRIALPGGTTPIPLLDRLAEKLPAELYAGLAVTWIDDRHVPLTDPESNFGLAQAHWFAKAPAPVNALPMWRGGDLLADRNAFAQAFAARFDSALDVVVVGLGEDGHVASLFPGDLTAELANGAVLAIGHAPKPPAERLTLTLPVLSGASYLALLATGAAKNAALRRVAERDPTLPASHLNPRGEYTWFLDPPAAKGLNL